jgi:hypothetical protein
MQIPSENKVNNDDQNDFNKIYEESMDDDTVI